MSRRLEALRAMADQDVSPFERDIARAKLQAAGIPPTPPRPPAPPASSMPDPSFLNGTWVNWSMSVSGNTRWNTTSGTFTVDFGGPR